METLHIHSQDDLSTVAEKILKVATLRAHKTGAVIIALEGDLGSGKTALCKALATKLGIVESVTSPTYVVMKVYEVTPPFSETFTQLYHLDAYRIEDIDEMRPLHFSEVLAQSHALVCIEWAEHIASLLPVGTIFVHLSHVHNSDERIITID
jgi:tRNA threonylcarbamoyladenosine biosynthesis protein TsaE